MNINKFTIKSQEATAIPTIGSGFWTALKTNVFKAIFDVDENVAPLF
jgi:hypothetical protein